MSQQEKKKKPVVLIGHQHHGKTTLRSAIKKFMEDDLSHVDGAAREQILSFEDIQNTSAYLEFIASSRVDLDPRLDWDAAVALLVVSAPDGPMPQTREHIKLAKEAKLPVIAVFLNKVDLVDDEELIDLVEMELQGLVGDRALMVRGSALQALENGKTEPISDLVSFIKSRIQAA